MAPKLVYTLYTFELFKPLKFVIDFNNILEHQDFSFINKKTICI